MERAVMARVRYRGGSCDASCVFQDGEVPHKHSTGLWDNKHLSTNQMKNEDEEGKQNKCL